MRAEGRTGGFAHGSELDVDAVIWVTGYRADHSWLELPVADEAGTLRRRRGVTEVPGLCFLGQHTGGSALLGFVADDAAFIASRLGSGPAPETTDRAQQAAGVAEGI